jgi:hypothetical protein
MQKDLKMTNFDVSCLVTQAWGILSFRYFCIV